MYSYIVCGGIICFVIAIFILVINKIKSEDDAHIESQQFDDLMSEFYSVDTRNDNIDRSEDKKVDENLEILNEIASQLKTIVELSNNGVVNKENTKELSLDIDNNINENMNKNNDNSQEFKEASFVVKNDIQEIIKYYKQGKSLVEIAKITGKGIREVEIILKLQKFK